MKSNQALSIVECVSWRKKHEKEGKNKNAKSENSITDMNIWHQTYEKTDIRVNKKQCKVSNRMNYL